MLPNQAALDDPYSTYNLTPPRTQMAPTVPSGDVIPSTLPDSRDDFNLTASGRRYRKHNTRLIARLRKAFPDDRFLYNDGTYYRYSKEQYVAGGDWYQRLDTESAEALLEEQSS